MNAKTKFIIIIITFIFMMIIINITNVGYYNKIEELSNEEPTNIEYQLNEDGYKKVN